MKKMLWLLVLFAMSPAIGFTQHSLEPLVGWGHDLKDAPFNFLITGLQYSKKTGSKADLLLKIERAGGFAVESSDAAFSANPAVPVLTLAHKTLRPVIYSFSTGMRLPAFKINKASRCAVLMYAGIAWQHFGVKYSYNKNDYTILNPDKSLDVAGLFVSGGLEYMHQSLTGKWFVDVLVSSPPARKRFKYPASFSYMAPLSLNAGYSFTLGKKPIK